MSRLRISASLTWAKLTFESDHSTGANHYGYTPQVSMIPTLYDVPRYAKLAGGEDRKRIADALEDCRRMVNDTLAQLA